MQLGLASEKFLRSIECCYFNFAGIRIHSGNKPQDTEGCILVGQTESKDLIGSSGAAFGPLFQKFQNALKTERVFVEIREQR
jgi:hypothetical protein